MIHIYGSYKCLYCRLSKKLSAVYNLDYKFYDINQIKNRLKIISLKQNGKVPKDYSNIPLIFINNKFIGGFNEFEKILESKKYKKNKSKSKKRTRKTSLKK